MARSISEIKKGMADMFMADPDIREAYGLGEGDTFSSAFSPVCVESILMYVVAACCHVLEVIFDRHEEAVEAKVEGAVVASVPWYHKAALAFQYGDGLVFDEATQRYKYAVEDDSKKVVRYAAVRDAGTSVRILVSGDGGDGPTPLGDGQLSAFRAYMDRVKVAGVVLDVDSLPPDGIRISAKVYVDPMVIGTDGSAVSGGGKPVEDAVTAYLRGIVYGGTFNKTKLVDAIQAVPGVADVELGVCSAKAAAEVGYKEIKGNNYNATGGSLVADGLGEGLGYEVQV